MFLVSSFQKCKRRTIFHEKSNLNSKIGKIVLESTSTPKKNFKNSETFKISTTDESSQIRLHYAMLAETNEKRAWETCNEKPHSLPTQSETMQIPHTN